MPRFLLQHQEVKRSVPTPEEPPVTQPAKVPKVEQAKVPKVEQANVGRLKAKGVKGQKTMPAEQQDAFSLGGGGDDMLDGDSGLSESDRAVLDNFDTKFAALKSLNPPLADGAFKAYLNDIAGTLSGFLNDVRLKKKSCCETTGKRSRSIAHWSRCLWRACCCISACHQMYLG